MVRSTIRRISTARDMMRTRACVLMGMSRFMEACGMDKNPCSCPLLHRVAGDVERKYHIRYYKTALCVHASDMRGQCTKNGAHCAFAHNNDDLRLPVFD